MNDTPQETVKPSSLLTVFLITSQAGNEVDRQFLHLRRGYNQPPPYKKTFVRSFRKRCRVGFVEGKLRFSVIEPRNGNAERAYFKGRFKIAFKHKASRIGARTCGHRSFMGARQRTTRFFREITEVPSGFFKSEPSFAYTLLNNTPQET